MSVVERTCVEEVVGSSVVVGVSDVVDVVDVRVSIVTELGSGTGFCTSVGAGAIVESVVETTAEEDL